MHFVPSIGSDQDAAWISFAPFCFNFFFCNWQRSDLANGICWMCFLAMEKQANEIRSDPRADQSELQASLVQE
jgi:hypothetical protein